MPEWLAWLIVSTNAVLFVVLTIIYDKADRS